MTRRVLVIGAGRRVQEAVLPALAHARGFADVQVFARVARVLEVAGTRHAVRPLAALPADGIRAGDLLVVAVSKDAVPAVLAELSARQPAAADLLLDTPVVRFKHFGHVRRLAAFRTVWVAEDVATLPWLDVVRASFQDGRLGPLREALFLQSGYRYHALAAARTLFGGARLVSARATRLGRGVELREVRFAGGRVAHVLEPRDYAVGRLLLIGRDGSLSDHPQALPGNVLLEPVVLGGRWTGFRAGDLTTCLDDDEVALLDGGDPAAPLTARMEDLKKVGLLRLLRAIAAGGGGYPLADALDDMVVDWQLERFGRYLATPLTRAGALPARLLFQALTRFS